MNNSQVAVVIPFYNEENRIIGTLKNLRHHLANTSYECILINDCSTDYSAQKVTLYLEEEKLNWVLLTNEFNIGHGPSVIRGLNFAVTKNYEFVVTVDGDGEIDFADFNSLIEYGLDKRNYVIEGVRRKRDQVFTRRFVSIVCRLVVLTATRQKSQDANTPIHFFLWKLSARF